MMMMNKKKKEKNFRKRKIADDDDDDDVQQDPSTSTSTSSPALDDNDDDEQRRLTLEEVKFLQKQRERKSGIPALPTTSGPQPSSSSSASSAAAAGLARKTNDNSGGGGDGGGDGDNEELVLQDTFAQETAVMVEDPIMLRYIEQELAKKRGKNIDLATQVDNDIKTAEDQLYKIPDHLKVKKRNSEESSTQWTTGIAEIQLPIEYKLKNIEETEAAKKLLQEKRLMGGRTKTNPTIPASYSADYFQRGKDYAEKLRREHPELYKGKSREDNVPEAAANSESGVDGAVRRQAATDEFMLDRFRKRERHRVMRR